MKRRTRYLIGVALALAALGVLTAAPAAQGQVPTPKPGLSDFGLSYSQIAVPAMQPRPEQLKPGLRDFGLSYSQIAVPPAQTRPEQLKPGLRDFGLSYGHIAVPPASMAEQATEQPVAIARSGGFDWKDAGVGAAAMLGIVLLVSGMGAGLLLRSQRREYRST